MMARRISYIVSGLSWLVALFACVITLGAFVETGTAVYMLAFCVSLVVFAVTGIWWSVILSKRGPQ